MSSMIRHFAAIYLGLTVPGFAAAHSVVCSYGPKPSGFAGPSPTWIVDVSLTGTTAETFSNKFEEDYYFLGFFDISVISGIELASLKTQTQYLRLVPETDEYRIVRWDWTATLYHPEIGWYLELDEEECPEGNVFTGELVQKYP